MDRQVTHELNWRNRAFTASFVQPAAIDLAPVHGQARKRIALLVAQLPAAFFATQAAVMGLQRASDDVESAQIRSADGDMRDESDSSGCRIHASQATLVTAIRTAVSSMHKAMASVFTVSLLLFALVGAPSAHAQSDFKVTLLGTASPQPIPDRFGPSTLVEAGDQRLLFDAGRGVPIRLRQINVPLGTITALFLTHYHSDHTSGIPDVWLTGWLPGPFARRTTPFRVIGPVGAKELMANLEKAYALDIKIRLEDEKLPPEGIATAVEEFAQDGLVYERGGVKVIAFTVDHGAAIKPAVGYRIEYNGHSIVISGDTRYNLNVIKYGTGADVLIHEVCVGRPELLSTNIAAQRVMAHHTSPQDAGKVFAQARPKLAVYTHLVFLADEKSPAPTVDDIMAQTRETYGGPLTIGEDLMSFDIGDTVAVHRYKQ